MHNAKCYYRSIDEGLPYKSISALSKQFTMFQRVVGGSQSGPSTL